MITTVINKLIMYIAVCGLLPLVIKKTLLNKLDKKVSEFLNLIIITILNIAYIHHLTTVYNVKLYNNITLKNILISITCSILFFILLDKNLDPFLDKLFVSSAAKYNKNIEELFQHPVIMFIRVCLVAPIVEEVLIRGFVLDSLMNSYTTIIALVISTILFAILHFNFVQTLSAMICGFILGLIYIMTGSLFCCVLTHSLYNTISYISLASTIKINA